GQALGCREYAWFAPVPLRVNAMPAWQDGPSHRRGVVRSRFSSWGLNESPISFGLFQASWLYLGSTSQVLPEDPPFPACSQAILLLFLPTLLLSLRACRLS